MPFSFMSPITYVLTAMCYTGLLGPECSNEPNCWNMTSYVSCYQKNFGDVHTLEYKTAVNTGKNIKPKLQEPLVVVHHRRMALTTGL